MESFLETLHQCGFSDQAAVSAYRAFSSFLLGYLLLEVSAQGADIGPIEQADPDDKPRTDLSEYPRLKSLEARAVAGPVGRRIRRGAGDPARPARIARPSPIAKLVKAG